MSDPTVNRSRLSPALRGVLALLVVSVFLNYIDRANLSVAAPLLQDELGISAAQLGILLSAFFWTYALCQILSGWLVDHFEVKWIFALGFLLWSTATAFTGYVHSLATLLIVRVVLGMGESVAYPSYSKILASHFAEHHRGLANALIAAGLALGPGLGMLFGGTLMARFGWRPFFIVLGLGSLLWLLPWLRWTPDAPTPSSAARQSAPTISQILRQRSAWGTCLTLFCANYQLYFMLTWLPFYLMRERGFSMPAMARIGAAYFIVAAVASTICGQLSDRWIAAGASPSRVRKGIMIVSSLACGVLLIVFVLTPGWLALLVLMLAGLGLGGSSSNIWAITQRLAGPLAAGRWSGIQNLVGNLSGVVAPAITGLLVQRTAQFDAAFVLTAMVVWVGTLGWIFVVGPIEPVNWALPLSSSPGLPPAQYSVPASPSRG